MFTNHFHMNVQPFCEKTPLELVQKDDRINEGLARLEYFSQQGSIALITGPTGVGKSTLVRLFLDSLAASEYAHAYVYSTLVRSTTLLKLIISAFGQTPNIYKDRVLGQIKNLTQKEEIKSIVVIDESQLLSSEALTELRLLASCATGEQESLKILIVGQERLKNKLKQPHLLDLLQRIQIRYQLKPFSKEQTLSYIDFQMQHAGASSKVFEPEVKSAIHNYTQGVCRQINNVATACLIQAAIKKRQKIDQQMFSQTISEFQIF